VRHGLNTCYSVLYHIRFWSSAKLQISTMCRPAFVFGNPLTTMYASPIVSTWKIAVSHVHMSLASMRSKSLSLWLKLFDSILRFWPLTFLPKHKHRLCVRVYPENYSRNLHWRCGKLATAGQPDRRTPHSLLQHSTPPKQRQNTMT